MTREELEVFYQLDEKKYLVNRNENLILLLKAINIEKEKDSIQRFIYKLQAWYELKFSNAFLDFIDGNTEKIKDSDIIKRMCFESLLQRFDTFELHLCQADGAIMLQLREELIYLAGLALIYSKNSTPEYGVYRAKAMFHDFEAYFQCALNDACYEPVIKRKYDPNDPEIIQLVMLQKQRDKKEKKNEDKSKDKSVFQRVRSLFRW